MFDVKEAFYKNFPNFIEKSPAIITKIVIKTLQKAFHEEKFKSIHDKNHYLTGLDFADSMLENLNITYTVKPNELKNIPQTGRLLIVANHITGASDAFSLVQLVGHIRDNKKVKVMVNGMLMGMEQASEILIPVDNISGSITKKSFQAINEALENEEVVIIFPSGMVNRLTLKGIKDTPWKPSFLKIAKRTSTPILPIKIDARNSILFYLVSIIFPKLSGLMLAHEFAIAGERKPLHFNIGKVIPVSSFLNKNTTISEYMEMFYKHLYTLGKNKQDILETEITIIQANNRIILKEEIKNSTLLGETSDGKQIVLTDATKSPFLMKELGRVREISFRAIGG